MTIPRRISYDEAITILETARQEQEFQHMMQSAQLKEVVKSLMSDHEAGLIESIWVNGTELRWTTSKRKK
jgi:hypothetical protein